MRIDVLITSIVVSLVVIAVMLSILTSKDKEIRMLRNDEQLYLRSIEENWKSNEIMMQHMERFIDELRVLRARDRER